MSKEEDVLDYFKGQVKLVFIYLDNELANDLANGDLSIMSTPKDILNRTAVAIDRMQKELAAIEKVIPDEKLAEFLEKPINEQLELLNEIAESVDDEKQANPLSFKVPGNTEIN